MTPACPLILTLLVGFLFLFFVFFCVHGKMWENAVTSGIIQSAMKNTTEGYWVYLSVFFARCSELVHGPYFREHTAIAQGETKRQNPCTDLQSHNTWLNFVLLINAATFTCSRDVNHNSDSGQVSCINELRMLTVEI